MTGLPVRVAVRVPATSANLGPGFDTLGLALSLSDVVEAAVGFDETHGEPAISVAVEGEGAHEVPRDARHLIVRAMLACYAELGMKPSTLALSCRNSIPHSRGLGSSAAAIVAGVLAARATSGMDLAEAAVLRLASQLEGHPDNVAPCVLGGFTIAWTGADGVGRAVRSDVHPDVNPLVCVPATPVATETARGLLPATVPHADAARNAGRAALLVEAMTRRPELLFEATEDRLHQSYREPAMPETIAVLESLRAHGVPAVVSGAGPTILALTRDDQTEQVRSLVPGWQVWPLRVNHAGATVDVLPDSAR